MNKQNDILKNQVDSLPEVPGVYQYFNNLDEIIYVGKAKNLKKRVSSYFNKIHEQGKTNVLVKNISSLKYIVVASEEDALLLENNLIKEYQPRYNVLLKDGKTYPSICITKEPFPRIFKVRNILKNGSTYYGPYSSVWTINALLEIIHQLYPIRTCKLPLFTDNIKAKKFKVCLQYHIHKCNGPCEDKESIEKYSKYIDEVKKIIEGDANDISKHLLHEMQALSNEYRFEEAQKIKLKYDLIENYKAKSIISNTVVQNTDVFGYAEDDQAAYINILRISKGSIIQGYTIEYKKKLNEEREDILAMAIVELRQKLNSDSKEIIVPFSLNIDFKGININIPSRGDRKKLLELSEQNVRQYKLDRLKQTEKLNPDQRTIQILEAIKEKLGLEKLPMHIECFDNSNIQGSDAVAACIVYKKAKQAKKEYRKYIIKTVEGPDDYASMYEVVLRRYSRLIKEETPLPDLIIADGGVGQMEIIRKVIQDVLKLDIAIAGMAKDSKHRTNEILVGFPPKVVGLKPTDQIFKFFAGMQDEVHRFAISFHRDKRSKTQVASELDNIAGIGEKTKNHLIARFKSVKRIRSAKIEELVEAIGNNRASIVYKHFNTYLKP